MNIYDVIQMNTLWISILDDDLLTGPARANKLIANEKLAKHEEKEVVIELFDQAIVTSSFLFALLSNTKFETIYIYGGSKEHNAKECDLAFRRFATEQHRAFAELPWWRRVFKPYPKDRKLIWVEKSKNERKRINTLRASKE